MLIHALVTAAAQIGTGVATGRWLIGGIAAVSFYIGREITQAEYRWIEAFGAGQRANMPWWGGFDPAAWTIKSILDIGAPMLVMAIVYASVTFLRK